MATIKSASFDDSKVSVTFSDGNTTVYHHIWLRDNCHCEECFYGPTKQRLLNTATLDLGIKPLTLNNDDDTMTIKWSQDNHKSEYTKEWLYLHAYYPRLVPVDEKLAGQKTKLKQQLWTVDSIKKTMPTVDFNQVLDSEDALTDWILKIWLHGFCLIDNVPVNPEDTQKLVERLMYIRPTHYGGFWDFTSDLAKADTAYTNFDIAGHTDGTYWNDTPGLQLFHLLAHDGEGGTTSLVDAFQCAKEYKKLYPEYFDLLTKIPVPAHSAGEEMVCIQPDIAQPIFKLDLQGELVQVRWNQSDRSCMDSWTDPELVPKFYDAITKWFALVTKPENELFYQLKPGQCLIFDNWRCFHSRTEFTGKRRMCGAYINRDDFMSALKIRVLGREAVLNSI
ncbi:uncharacterized protein KQ657_001488 [Scheffersomyces spartinae]|uniref:Trimethyllysine dioxygenase n=1 Tax=Scheffersomyces spartinae TaxID=45513 RepID=A0A9P7V7L2_9ASCO|nr:uncharacterized protein KQ657_001488 [Scheffersomyces spartinae]KAG7192705.1 hypothetical protein KQ657_001488 [Scheffersomyces spartinae]